MTIDMPSWWAELVSCQSQPKMAQAQRPPPSWVATRVPRSRVEFLVSARAFTLLGAQFGQLVGIFGIKFGGAGVGL